MAFIAPLALVHATEILAYKQVDGRDLKLFIEKPADWKASDQRPAIVFFSAAVGWAEIRASSRNKARISRRVVGSAFGSNAA